MKNLSSRPYRILADHMEIYRFLTEIYEPDFRNGVPAPFVEYALSSDWTDKSFAHRWRIWEENGRIAAFCFTESPVTDAYFCLRPGYECLADEMVEWAAQHFPGDVRDRRLVLANGQTALIEAAKRHGYIHQGDYTEYCYSYDQPLEYPLPEGFHFTEPGGVDQAKATECCWKGFDHEEEGPWNGNFEGALRLMAAPHATPDWHIAVQDEQGNYACYAGMWWTPENHLAYLEPLCTVPAHRRKGLASALLSELSRRMKRLGATHMTGGGKEFYPAIGFKPTYRWTYWKNQP